MPSRADVTYFGSGPAALPTDVLEQSAAALLNYNDTGLGLAEHSHRASHATTIINEAKADLAAVLDIPTDEYEILFMQGGGTGEFAAVVYNLVAAWVARKHATFTVAEATGSHEDTQARLKAAVDTELKLDYIVTGGWSDKACKEAQQLLGKNKVNVVADARQTSADGKFGSIPDESTWKLSEDAALVHYCDNETVFGVEFPEFPKALLPREGQPGPIVVADMSSNILTRAIPVRNYGLIYFGAQKNLGITGLSVVVVRKNLLPPALELPSPELLHSLGLPATPTIFSYGTMAKNNSLYNTLSIFDVYVSGLVLKKLRATYPEGVAGQQAITDKKAALIYGTLEAHPEVYRPTVPQKSARSRTNICFRVTKGGDVDSAEKRFLDEATARGLLGVKGHRSVGGMRACNFNAIPLEGAQKLVEFLEEFARA